MMIRTRMEAPEPKRGIDLVQRKPPIEFLDLMIAGMVTEEV